MEIYKAPESELEDSPIEKKPNIFWKIFFWLNVALVILIPFVIISAEDIHYFDYIDLVVFFPLVLFCLFCYAYSKRFFQTKVYSVIFYVYGLWAIFYEIISSYILGIPSYGRVAEFDLWILLNLLFLVPTFIALYRLSTFKNVEQK